jgi:D-serine deaminase-like pyridoxal phosphate-dependent protein
MKNAIPTPALLVDLPAMERNINRMAEHFAARPCKLRPHFKAHKTPEIARRQLAAGSCIGLTCATVAEAEVVSLLTDDVLVANEIVDIDQCERLARLAVRVKVRVAVDSQAGVSRVAEAAVVNGVTIGMLVDLDVGQHRCGVSPGAEALALARLVDAASGVALHGVMGYGGHLQPVRNRGERESRTREAMIPLIATAELLRSSGLPCEVVSGGGTGTYDIDGDLPGITEVQAGSYVLMDSDYGELDLPFEQALSVLGTVVSRKGERCVTDCGHKTMTMDHGLPLVKGLPGASVAALNDEHAIVTVPLDCELVVGDRLELLPSHIDPTINLHDAIFAMDGDSLVSVWPIVARGYADERAALD